MSAEAQQAARHIGPLLQDLAERRGPSPALIDAEGVLSWSEFGRRLRQTAHALLSLGLRAGDRVALSLPDTRRYLESDYGIMSAGLVRVPIDPRLPRQDLTSLLKSSGARAMIAPAGSVPQKLSADAPELEFLLARGGPCPGAMDFDAMVEKASADPLPPGDPEDLASLNYSGGTTGAPKGIALTHRNLCAVLEYTVRAFDIRPNARFLNVRPLWPIAQLVMMSHLAAGGAVILGGRFDPSHFADLVHSSGADRTSLVPTQTFRLLDHLSPNDFRMQRLEAIYVGGSRLAPDLFERITRLIGPRIGVLYGMTEAPISCYLPPATAMTSSDAMASVGTASPGCEVKIEGEEGPTDAPDMIGEVVIRGEHVMRGYWGDVEATRTALRNGWLHTGDLGAFDQLNRLRIVGRIKEVIRSGAQSVVPAEVEDTLMLHPAILEAAVVGLPDREWGEAVTAFVVLKPGELVDESEIARHCQSHLAGFKRPRAIRFIQSLPRSHYGKVLRAQLIADAAHE